MTPEDWQRVKELCALALEHLPEQRTAFLADACGDDESIRREVEALIAHATASEGIFETPLWHAAAGIPASLGPYRVLELVGEGGMGIVYKAQQDRPQRIVALKVIKPGLATSEMLRRFERESDALARLQHPGIARIYEVGTAGAGGTLPYFAMEFINGTPLRDYAESRRLETRERLALMAHVCDAVEHAHKRGIIHRDLKPGNILLDESGQPKILDFGVARVTDRDAHVTRQTDLGQLVGTLAYMSPEQVLADPLELDTRSDVYALGVILYELLARRLPYPLSGKLVEAARTIQEDDPARLSSIDRAFRGDVETIVAKALEKDKTRRYASAADLAADIRRYLSDEPIAARPTSTVYQLRKFARRHMALVGATATVFVVLVAGVAISTREAIRARQAEQTAQAVGDFLRNDLLAQASVAIQATPGSRPNPEITVRTVLDRAAARVTGKFDGQPAIEATIRDTIGQTYLDLGLYAEARTHLERALALYRQTRGPEDATVASSLTRLGRAAYLQGRYPEARALFMQAIEINGRRSRGEDPDTLTTMNALAVVYLVEGKHDLAETLHTQTLEARRRVLGPEHIDTATSMHNLAIVYYRQGKYAQSETLHRQALDIRRRALGNEHPNTLSSLGNLANVYLEQGKHGEAESLYNEVLEIRRRLLGEEHPDTVSVVNSLGMIYTWQGKFEQAGALFARNLEIWRRVMGPENPDTPVHMNNLAVIYSLQGEYAKSEVLFKDTLDLNRRLLGPEHPTTLSTIADLASMYRRQGKFALAELYGTQALDARRRVLGSTHPDMMSSAADQALTYVLEGKFLESEQLAREVLEFDRTTEPDVWTRFRDEALLGASLAGQKAYSEAESLLIAGYRGMAERKDRMGAPNADYLNRAGEWTIDLYRRWGKPERAVEWRERVSANQ